MPLKVTGVSLDVMHEAQCEGTRHLRQAIENQRSFHIDSAPTRLHDLGMVLNHQNIVVIRKVKLVASFSCSSKGV